MGRTNLQVRKMFRYLPPEKLEKSKRLHFESKLRSYKKYLLKRREENPYYKIRQNLNLIRINNRIGSQTNTLRWSNGETKQHILKKLEICMELKEWGHEFLTEAIFKNGMRCDILDLTGGTIYEILHYKPTNSTIIVKNKDVTKIKAILNKYHANHEIFEIKIPEIKLSKK